MIGPRGILAQGARLAPRMILLLRAPLWRVPLIRQEPAARRQPLRHTQIAGVLHGRRHDATCQPSRAQPASESSRLPPHRAMAEQPNLATASRVLAGRQASEQLVSRETRQRARRYAASSDLVACLSSFPWHSKLILLTVKYRPEPKSR